MSEKPGGHGSSGVLHTKMPVGSYQTHRAEFVNEWDSRPGEQSGQQALPRIPRVSAVVLVMVTPIR